MFNKKYRHKYLVLQKKTVKKTLLLILFIGGCFAGLSQDVYPPFKKTMMIPEFSIENAKDSSTFTEKNLAKNKKTIFIYFSPDCGHCTFFVKKMLDSISLVKNTEIVMVAAGEFSKIKSFYEEYKLNSYPFITVGRDRTYFFISHFGITQYPAAFVYNKKGKFVKNFESEIGLHELFSDQ